MTGSMVHRGPDEAGFYRDASVSLGMTRLAVMAPSDGSQPLSNEDNSLQVIANCELYDFEDTRRGLERRGHTFRTGTDAEVLLHLYEEYDLEMFEHVDGMFAFALWDRNRNRLLIARDRFGIKPLHYSRPMGDGLFGFCSEISPLLELSGLRAPLDPVAIGHYFTLGYVPHPRTAFKNVLKLDPGCFVLAEGERVECHRYWDFPESSVHENGTNAVARLDHAIGDAVRRMVRADVPVGAFLSGGLDSGTVVHHMARLSTEPVRTFSVRFQEREFDEGEVARETATSFGTHHTEVWARPEHAQLVCQLQAHFGEPFSDHSQIPTYLVSRAAREHVTVILSGDGGDELLGGYQTYRASLLSEHVQFMPDILRRAGLAFSQRLRVSKRFAEPGYRLRKFLSACHLAPHERHLMWRMLLTAKQRCEMYTESFRQTLGAAPDDELSERWAGLFRKGREPLTSYQFLDIRTYLTDNNLAKVDRMSMANSLEVRLPFLDRGVFDAALALPPDWRIRGRVTKVGLRYLMRDRLPPSVLGMRKHGFAAPISDWLRGPLREWVRSVLDPDRVQSTSILSPPAVRRLMDDHLEGRRDHGHQIWNLICFMAWFENVQA